MAQQSKFHENVFFFFGISIKFGILNYRVIFDQKGFKIRLTRLCAKKKEFKKKSKMVYVMHKANNRANA